MYNWNTDTSKFKNPEDKKVWEIVQLLEYGTRGKKIKKTEIIKYWPRIKDQLDPEMKRLLEYVIWGKVYSLPISNSFWIQSSPLQKLPIRSI